MSSILLFRKKLGLSQRQVAALFDINQSAVNHAETGRTGTPKEIWPKMKEYEEVLKHLGIYDKNLELARDAMRADLISKLQKTQAELELEQRRLLSKLTIIQEEFQKVYKALKVIICEKENSILDHKKAVEEVFQTELKKFLSTCTEQQHYIGMRLSIIEYSLSIVKGQIETYQNWLPMDEFMVYVPVRRY